MIAQDRQPYLNTRHDNPFQFFGARTVWRSVGETTDGRFCLLEATNMPPGLASPYHVPHNEDEAFYILEGTVAVLCGGTWHIAGPGTWVYGPRDIPHGFRVIGTSPASMLLQCAPAGFEGFVRELSMPVDAVPAPPDAGLLVATAAKYGVDLLGPLPETPAQQNRSGYDVAATLSDASDELRRLHMAAVNRGDAIGASELFAPDGVLLPPEQPALVGAKAIGGWLTGLFASVRVQDFVIEPADVKTFGDALVEHGTWSATFHPKNNAEMRRGGGTYMTLYARGADGSVRMAKETFNGLPV